MTYQLCHYSLIYPGWLPWLLFILGLLAILFSSSARDRVKAAAQTTIKVWGVKVSGQGATIVFFVGLLVSVIGLLGAVAWHYEPFARTVGVRMPMLVHAADASVSVDLSNIPLSQLRTELRSGELFIIRISQGAEAVRLTGIFSEAFCAADLVVRICRSESQNLVCDVDLERKVVRVCGNDDRERCIRRSL